MHDENDGVTWEDGEWESERKEITREDGREMKMDIRKQRIHTVSRICRITFSGAI